MVSERPGETITCFDLFARRRSPLLPVLFVFLSPSPPHPHPISDISGMQRQPFLFLCFFSISSPPQHRAFEISDRTTYKRTPPLPTPPLPKHSFRWLVAVARPAAGALSGSVCTANNVASALSLSFFLFFHPCRFSLSFFFLYKVFSPLMLWELTVLSTQCRAQHVAPPHCFLIIY